MAGGALMTSRREEDEGLTAAQMDEERARDEAERDENGETE